MAGVYFHIPRKQLADAAECGLKLSEWVQRRQATRWNNNEAACFTAYLHPRDDFKFHDPAFQCIKLDIDVDDVIVADNDLYMLSLECPEVRDDYLQTMVRLKEYAFGSFRKPECLIFTTILPDQISIPGKRPEDPLLYESSEKLYVSNLLERYQDRYDEINSALLYCFLARQEEEGLNRGYCSEGSGIALFKDDNRYITVPVPKLQKYRLKSIY